MNKSYELGAGGIISNYSTSANDVQMIQNPFEPGQHNLDIIDLTTGNNITLGIQKYSVIVNPFLKPYLNKVKLFIWVQSLTQGGVRYNMAFKVYDSSDNLMGRFSKSFNLVSSAGVVTDHTPMVTYVVDLDLTETSDTGKGYINHIALYNNTKLSVFWGYFEEGTGEYNPGAAAGYEDAVYIWIPGPEPTDVDHPSPFLNTAWTTVTKYNNWTAVPLYSMDTYDGDAASAVRHAEYYASEAKQAADLAIETADEAISKVAVLDKSLISR